MIFIRGLYLVFVLSLPAGELPSCVGSLSCLTDLELRGNQFEGRMFAYYFACDSRCHVLILLFALYAGHLPESLGDLTGLLILDLSENHFIGDTNSR